MVSVPVDKNVSIISQSIIWPKPSPTVRTPLWWTSMHHITWLRSIYRALQLNHSGLQVFNSTFFNWTALNSFALFYMDAAAAAAEALGLFLSFVTKCLRFCLLLDATSACAHWYCALKWKQIVKNNKHHIGILTQFWLIKANNDPEPSFQTLNGTNISFWFPDALSWSSALLIYPIHRSLYLVACL